MIIVIIVITSRRGIDDINTGIFVTGADAFSRQPTDQNFQKTEKKTVRDNADLRGR